MNQSQKNPETKGFISMTSQIFMEVKVIPVFVVLGNWTDQGIRKITEAPKRAESVHSMVNKAGGKMQVFYTMGKYDFVSIIEVPKDEDAMSILLCIASMGNVRTVTMKAWTESEAAKLLTAPHP